MKRWFWISLSYATFGVAIEHGIVTDAAPIAGWALGKPARELAFYRRKGAKIVELAAATCAMLAGNKEA